MSVKQLKADTIGQIDNGKAGDMIDAAIREAVKDCEQRGHRTKKDRVVGIKIKIAPAGDDSEATVKMEVTTKVPANETQDMKGQIRKPGRDLFTLAFESDDGNESPKDAV